MDLRELVPTVPEDVKELELKSNGIYVVTLQLWLRMLGFDLGKIDGIFGNKTEKAFKNWKGLPSDDQSKVKVTYDEWVAMDALLRAKLPPDPETLVPIPFPRKNDYETDEAYAYALQMGLGHFGFRIPAQKGTHYLEVDGTGLGILENVPPGIYELEIVESTDTSVSSHTTSREGSGSLEVKVFDEMDNPIRGKVKLTNKTPDPESLRKSIRLFKALAREVEVLEDKHEEEVNRSIIDGELVSSNHRIWDTFSNSWGQFYGAPWMGIMYDPIIDETLKAKVIERSWTTFETASILYQWASEHIKSADHNDYRPIAVRHLNHRYGGLIQDRIDFSQTGYAVSLHLPRKSSRKVKNKNTGQDYGLIDYQSSEYHLPAYDLMFKNLITIDSDYQIKSPDQQLVADLNDQMDQITEGDLVWDSHLSVNAGLWRKRLTRIAIEIRFKSGNEELSFPVRNATVKITDVHGKVKDLSGRRVRSRNGKKETTETDRRGKVKLPKRYLRNSKRDPDAPYSITITTPDKNEITKQIVKKVGKKLLLDSIGDYLDYSGSVLGFGLYQLKNKKWTKFSSRQAYKDHRSLLRDDFIDKLLLSKLKCPFKLNANQQAVIKEDDYYLSPIRIDELFPHYAIDLGSRIYFKKEDQYRSLDDTTKVHPIIEEGFVKATSVQEVEQRVCLKKGDFRLVVELNYTHVKPHDSLKSNWTSYDAYKAKVGASIGTLWQKKNNTLWTAFVKPYVFHENTNTTPVHKKKGNHIHLITYGIYDITIEFPKKQDQENYDKETFTFYNSILLPAIC